IVKKEIPAKVVYEDDVLIAFHDIAPAAEHHILIIPKRHIMNCNEFKSSDRELLEHLKKVAETQIRRLVSEDPNLQNTSVQVGLGFTRPPWNSVNHVHCHAVTLPIKTGFLRKMFLQGGLFVGLDDVLNRLSKEE
ncbi:Histidine triad nucleotide-binding protein 3, partial [Blyttiomyces sp. JEL0837]